MLGRSSHIYCMRLYRMAALRILTYSEPDRTPIRATRVFIKTKHVKKTNNLGFLCGCNYDSVRQCIDTGTCISWDEPSLPRHSPTHSNPSPPAKYPQPQWRRSPQPSLGNSNNAHQSLPCPHCDHIVRGGSGSCLQYDDYAGPDDID